MKYRNMLIKAWPFIIATLVLVAFMLISVRSVMIRNNGHFGYALDDTYIHMAISKNVESHGVYGITRHAFTSSSSSPVWTFLFSFLFFVFGVNDSLPFIVNLTLSVILLGIFFSLLSGIKLSGKTVFVVLLSVILFTPLHALILGGMEHVLHSILTVLFVYFLAEVLMEKKGASKSLFALLAIALLLTGCRYEGLFLVFVAILLLCLRSQFKNALSLLIISALPIVTLGMISLSKGWFFLPTTILIKGQAPVWSLTGIKMFLINGMDKLMNNQHLLVLLLLSLVLFLFLVKKENSLWRRSNLYLFIFIHITWIHLLFAQTGWVYRYEAYLVVLGIFTITFGAREYNTKWIGLKANPEKLFRYFTMLFFLAVVLYPLTMRSYRSFVVVQQGVKNIYEQQYQMGLFIKEYYQGKGVALNDIGAVIFLSDIICTDLIGLGNLEVARARKDGTFSTQTIDHVCKNESTRIAIVYDDWFQGKQMLPKHWIKAGEWTIENNLVCGSKSVAFYAVDTLEINYLSESLKRYSVNLPTGVQQVVY